MPLFWLSLTLAVALVVSSAIYLTSKGLEAFRGFKRLSAAAAGDLAKIEAASAGIERHLTLAAEGGTRLEASLARLERSRAQLTVLTSALADARASLNRLTGLVPKK